jgi:hypothetical protein
MDACLRHVAHALLAGTEVAAKRLVSPADDAQIHKVN